MKPSFLSLTACALALALQPPAVAGPKIGLLMKDRGVFWTSVEAGANESITAAGGSLISKGPQTASNLGQQLALLSLLSGEEGLTALLVSPLTIEEFKKPLALLKAKGVKIVVLDTPPSDAFGDTFVGYNQEAMAREAGRFFAGLTGPADEVAMLRANTLERISTREKIFLATIKEFHADAVVHMDVMAGATKEDDYPQSCLLLERHPGIRAVATMFTAPSLGMLRAIKDKEVGGKIQHLGFGTGLPAAAVEALEAGRLQAWVAQQPSLIGKKAVEAALALLAGKAVPPSIDVEYFIVTKTNLTEPKIQALRQ